MTRDRMVTVETDIDKIKRLSEKKEDENWRFRTFLKGCDLKKIDSIVHRLYRKVSSEIDCKTCANCCKELNTVMDQADINRFSRGLGISAAQFRDQYLVKADHSDGYMFNAVPCPFLNGNLCSNYDYRPKECISYPHLHKKEFIFRLMGVIDNCSVCPIVFNVYENLKREVWRRRFW